jgi:hypothetical protein
MHISPKNPALGDRSASVAPGVTILEWRPLRKNSLLGFAKIQLPSGMVVSDVTVLASERGPWASPPSKPMISRDGAVLKDDNGKIKYAPVISFASKTLRDRFSHAVIEALRHSDPEALT